MPVPEDPPGITRKTLLKAAVATGLAAPLVAAGGAFASESDSEARSGSDSGAYSESDSGPRSGAYSGTYSGTYSGSDSGARSGVYSEPVATGPNGPRAITPACHDGDAPTIDQTEGPYFKPDSPQRTVLAPPGTPGTALTVTGVVYGLSCLPIAAALLDFWQADDSGDYDMTGFDFRGHQYTDADGTFTLTTIVPGLYPGRTKHIHVKVQAPNQPILTTQLYFPGVPQNATDSIFDARLLMDVSPQGAGETAAFDFVLNVPQNPGGGPPPGTSWVPGHTYDTGDTVTYDGTTYACLQAHTSQVGWEPPNAPALWRSAVADRQAR